ncbi:MAG: ATP-dependent DNA helicase RecG [Ancrocorticia sp.]|jgi:ATP-dependent DNA helicase RecG|nr:ATP-dependent DNA helicase RecG [Ancrocorticia sp.]MCI1932766.1 ATP-dependent DNA helicase RecG [Ancrocorticia sp.]MCI2013323.1 ATP-dependent DNA helicase RecG [Ancrocorticia sp.]MCI2030090.1 ATP-dependent DNA helicase RecG [Ancrocorticia sp.]
MAEHAARHAEPGVASDAWTGLARPLERALGKRTANAFAAMGIHTVGDLVMHFPFRLGHRGQLMPIAAVSEGEDVTVIARVLTATLRPMNTRRGFILTVRITDGVRDLALTFFAKNQRPLQYHERRLTPGTVATFSGTISTYRGEFQLTHPDYEVVDDEPDVAKIEAPIPIYHANAKLPSWQIARAIATVLPQLSEDDFPDPLPEEYRRAQHLPGKYHAVLALHHPTDDAQWKRAVQRMKHEEAFVLQTALASRRAQAKENTVPAFPCRRGGILDAFDARLPFKLTAGQRHVGDEIAAELAGAIPMRRLLQGDVGSGKTVVALRAMLQVVDAGGQAAFLVPTEVLAWQHYQTIRTLLGPLARGGELGSSEVATRVEILTGSMGAQARRQALAHIASGEAGVVIGTHALLSDNVQIPFLGLTVIDEQHRFGVDQRTVLASGVHELVMTATPIPRTIAMSVFGDLDVSTLRELPSGRAHVSTTVVPVSKRAWMDRVWERVAEEVRADGRVFVVCPRIDKDSADETEGSSDVVPAEGAPEMPIASVAETVEFLRRTLPQIAVGQMHGRLTGEEKASAMERFINGETPILVSTTVIEVGVDVPDATCMVILDADRFGLSQLHQLRGRIGRGSRPGVCLAVTGAADGTAARQRLEAFAETTDGFALAEKDVELRKEGDVLGASQSGRTSHLRFLSVTRDDAIIRVARQAARHAVEASPTLAAYPALAGAVAALDQDRAEYLERA